jgi:hypothetical protein
LLVLSLMPLMILLLLGELLILLHLWFSLVVLHFLMRLMLLLLVLLHLLVFFPIVLRNLSLMDTDRRAERCMNMLTNRRID